MALETVTVRMSRSDPHTAWGFRLQGGHEFSTPLLVGKVIAGGLAERAGLRENDRAQTLCGHDATSLRHKDAQNVIVGAGNSLDLVVIRSGAGAASYVSAQSGDSTGGSLHRDIVTTTSHHSLHTTGGVGGMSNYQTDSTSVSQNQHPPEHNAVYGGAEGRVNVSLEHQKQGGGTIPGFNVSAAPFATQKSDYRSVQHENKPYSPAGNTGGMETVGKITYRPGGGGEQDTNANDDSAHRAQQYNSPRELYSPNAAAQAYRQQAGGLFGTE